MKLVILFLISTVSLYAQPQLIVSEKDSVTLSYEDAFTLYDFAYKGFYYQKLDSLNVALLDNSRMVVNYKLDEIADLTKMVSVEKQLRFELSENNTKLQRKLSEISNENWELKQQNKAYKSTQTSLYVGGATAFVLFILSMVVK